MQPSAGSEEKMFCRRLAAGDAAACRELVSRFSGLVYSLAYRLLADSQEAEDLTQEVFLQVYVRASEFRGDAKLSTWIYRITYNLGLNYRRDLKRERTELAATPPEPIQSGHGAEGSRDLDIFAALGALSTHDQTILALHYVHDQSVNEIGEILEISVPAVKVRLFRARERLKSTVATRCDPQEVAS